MLLVAHQPTAPTYGRHQVEFRARLRPKIEPSESTSSLALQETDRPAEAAAAAITLPDISKDVDITANPLLSWESKLDPVTDAWVEANVLCRRPEEATALKGLGRWLGCQAMLKARPDWSTLLAADQTTALWDDEASVATSALTSDYPQLSIKKSLMVLRMLDSYLGTDLVDTSVRKFLRSATCTPSSLEDFYALLKTGAPKDKPMPEWNQAAAWFKEAGHPMVASRLVGKGAKTCVQLKQSGFSVYQDQPVDHQGVTWAVPLRIKFKDEEGVKEISAVLDRPEALVELPAKGRVSWAYPNGGGAGVFRTRLEGQELRAITKDAALLSPAEQGALACNQWRLVRHGVANVGEFYDLCLASRNTLDAGLHSIFEIEFGTHSNYVPPETRQAFDKFWAHMVGPVARARGLEPAPDDDKERVGSATNAVQVLARVGAPDALRLARKWAEEYKVSGQPAVRYNTHTFSGDPEILQRLEKRAADPSVPVKDRVAALSDLSFWPTPEGARAVLSILEDPESALPEKERDKVRSNLVYGHHGRDLLFSAFQEHPTLFEKNKSIVQNTYGFPCYRRELDMLLQNPKIAPAVRDELVAHFGQADRKTLARLGQDIQAWLSQNGFMPAHGAIPTEWHLTALGCPVKEHEGADQLFQVRRS